IVSGEQQLDATPLANEYGACQVNGVERLDDRRHRFRRFVDNRPAQSNAPHCSFDLDQFLSSPGDLSVVVESLESKPIDRPATFDAQKLTGIGCRPFAPAAQPAGCANSGRSTTLESRYTITGLAEARRAACPGRSSSAG